MVAEGILSGRFKPGEKATLVAQTRHAPWGQPNYGDPCLHRPAG
jgi:hypothetical protein